MGKNNVCSELKLLCLVLDKSIMGNPEFPKTESCEMLCRRIYAIRRAFREVHCLSDWKPPKGAGAKWKSKVRWDLANEIDWQGIVRDKDDLPELEKEVTDRLKEKALITKTLNTTTSEAVEVED